MPRIEILHISPKGDYKISRAKQRPEWPNLVDTRKQSYQLLQNPVFTIPRSRMGRLTWEPSRYHDDWSTFLSDPPPPANLDSERSLMVVYENFTFPLSPRPELENAMMQQLGVAFDEECEQSGRNQSSFEQFGYGARRASMVIFSLVLFAVALLIGGGVAIQKFGGG